MNNDLALSQLFCEHHPSDAASILARLPPETVGSFIAALPASQGIELIHHMPTAYATQLLAYIEDEHSARLLALADFTTLTRLLRPIPERQRQALMAGMKTEDATQLNRILAFPQGSVGYLVEIPTLTALGDWNVKHARQELKKITRRTLAEFPVVDDEHRFLGMVSIHKLLSARDNRRLDDLCVAKESALPAYTTVAAIVNHPSWQTNLSLPVIDHGEILLGLLQRTAVNNHIASNPRFQANDVLAPVMALAELYWAGSSSALNILGKKPPTNGNS